MKTILITGADRGLGFALVQTFLSSGHTIFACTYESGEELHSLSLDNYQNLFPIPMDITDENSVKNAAKRIADLSSNLDILINNAGIHLETSRKPLEEADFDAMSAMFHLNTLGPLRVTREFLPLLRQGRLKRVINISSEAGSIEDCNWRKSEFGYCMSKAALNMQSKILHNYLSPEGFKILSIHPGWMRTDMGGPDADITASESATGIARLALQDGSEYDGIYFDYQGNPLPW